MKHKLLHFKSILCSLGILLLLIGCQNDEGKHAHNESLKVQKVSLAEIPAIKDVLELKSRTVAARSNGETNYFAYANPENVYVYTDDEGLNTYTFSLSLAEPENQMSNLVIREMPDGTFQYRLMKYESDEMATWKQDIVSGIRPTATVRISSEILEAPLQRGGGACDTFVTDFTCPSGMHNGWSRSECVHEFYTWSTKVTVMSLDCGREEGGGGAGPGSGGGFVSVPNAPVNLLANFVSGFSTAQKTWWDTKATSSDKTSISNYLNSNAYMASSKEFVTKFIQANIDTGLSLDFNKSLKSPMNVDMSSVSGNSPEEMKLNKIYEKLLLSPSFKNLFSNVFDRNDRVSVKFKIENASTIGYALGQTTHKMVNGKLQINIAVNRQFLLSQGDFSYGSNVYVAKVIAHECLHAFIQDIRINSTQHPNISIDALNGMTLGEAINDYVNVYGSEYEHEFMASKLIPELVKILDEIKTLIIPQTEMNFYPTLSISNNSGLNEPWTWNNLFKFISMEGLMETDYFKQNVAVYRTVNINGRRRLELVSITNQENYTRFIQYLADCQMMSRVIN